MGDRIALLFHGKLVADAPAKDFFSLDTPEVRQLRDGLAEGPLLEKEELGSRSAPR